MTLIEITKRIITIIGNNASQMLQAINEVELEAVDGGQEVERMKGSLLGKRRYPERAAK